MVSNEIVAGLDWLPTFAAAAGEPKIADKLKAGTTLDGQSYKVHLDGHNLLPYLTGQSEQGPRREFFYFSDDGDLMALRYDNWKLIFMEQRSPGTMALWAEPFTVLRVPKLFNLRTDPFEKADVTANTYYDWFLAHAFLLVPAQRVVADFLSTFKEFPPRQKAGSFTIDQVLANLVAGMPSA
ncbi:hypothetical protein [Streptomyces sp. CBMA123]|uniref:hypothetical protein n=1 Tax=Streptomyces sp. CBMA123 TaxID=1896313 RepID=UPI003983565D